MLHAGLNQSAAPKVPAMCRATDVGFPKAKGVLLFGHVLRRSQGDESIYLYGSYRAGFDAGRLLWPGGLASVRWRPRRNHRDHFVSARVKVGLSGNSPTISPERSPRGLSLSQACAIV